MLCLSRHGRQPAGVHDAELFESIYTPGKLLLLVSWRDAAAADDMETARSAAIAPSA